MLSTTTNHHAWWQPQELAINACWHYRLGPLHVYVQRQAQQWLLAYEYNTEEKADPLFNNAVNMIPVHLTCQRYLFKQSPAIYQLLPQLLDRPIVVKTFQPVSLPPNEQTTFYISSPVSVRLTLKQPDIVLQDIIVQRLSDTWFGPSTQVGELCYADKSNARHTKAELPQRSYRAITPVTIHNNSSKMLSIDKISVPVPYLSLFALPDGNLWTNPITLKHEELEPLTHFRTGKLSASDAAGATLLSEPMLKSEKHNLFRAFADILTTRRGEHD